MDDFADEGVRSIDCMCSAQSCKTVTMMGLLGWTFIEDPGPTLWVTKSKPEAIKLVKGRLWPMYDKTECIAEKMPKQKGKRNLLSLYFPGTYFHVVGAENDADLQSTPYRYTFRDEVRQWKKGALDMVDKRTRMFPYNYKHVTISCPDMEGDDVHRGFLRGNQNHWFIKCRNCPGEFELTWGEKKLPGGLKWDTNEVTCPDGKRNIDETVKTLRFECPHCNHRYTDIAPNQADRKYFTRNGRWIPANPTAASNAKSYHWNALLPHMTDWAVQVAEYFTSLNALQWADHAPYKDHWNETRGLPWTDRLRYQKEEKFLDQRIRPYSRGDRWDLEKRRILTADLQAKGGRHYWVNIRAWGYYGVSRWLHFSKALSIEDIKKIQSDYGVLDENVAIDAAWSSAEAYKMVVESGYKWKAMRGEDVEHFLVKSDNGPAVKRMWDVSPADPALGTTLAGRVPMIPLYRFSKPATLERLFLMMYGELGDWQLHEDADTEYKLQVAAWDRRFRTNRLGAEVPEWYQKRKDDHATATERMQIAIADITGLLRPPEQGQLL